MKGLRWLLILAGLLWMPAVGAAHPLEFRSYEVGGVFPEIYRDDFAQTRKKYPNGRFARAYRGERASLHRYFTRALDASLDRDRNPALGYVLVKIMFGVRDERFSRALRAEDFAARQAVGRAIDGTIARYDLHFPRTRASYRYRAADAR